MKSNTVIKFKTGAGVLMDTQVHSYSEVMNGVRACQLERTDDRDVQSAAINENVHQKSVCHMDENCVVLQHNTPSQDESMEDLPPILRIVDRDKAKNFTEYLFSRPVTFAHKCEDAFCTFGALAAFFAVVGAVAIANTKKLPGNEMMALWCFGAVGVCFSATALSAVVGGVSEYFADRKKKMMQECRSHVRD